MNDSNRNGDPRDQIDQRAGQAQQTAQQPRGRQEIQGPMDSMDEQTLSGDMARMELDQAIATAHRFPRKIDVFVQKIEQMALYDEAAAGRSIYMLPRADKAIIGPSIGFANLMATAWGNCRDAGYWVRTDRQEKVVVCQGVFFDLESNRITMGSAMRRISSRDGRLYNDDMIVVTAQAGAAIGRRNAILNGVPRPLWQPTYEKCLVVVRGTQETLAERREKMIAVFAGYGIEAKKVLMAIGAKDMKDVTLDHMVMLRGMFEALKDGTVTADEMFDPRKMTGMGFEQVKNPLADDEDDGHDDDGVVTSGTATAGTKPAVAQTPQQQQPQEGAGKPKDEPAPAQAQTQGETAGGEQAATTSKSKGGGKKKADAKPAEQQQEDPKPAPKIVNAAEPETAAAPPLPKTPEEYEVHCMAYIEAATVAADLDNRWRGEKDLRTNCMIVEDVFLRCSTAYRAKLAALRGG